MRSPSACLGRARQCEAFREGPPRCAPTTAFRSRRGHVGPRPAASEQRPAALFAALLAALFAALLVFPHTFSRPLPPLFPFSFIFITVYLLYSTRNAAHTTPHWSTGTAHRTPYAFKKVRAPTTARPAPASKPCELCEMYLKNRCHSPNVCLGVGELARISAPAVPAHTASLLIGIFHKQSDVLYGGFIHTQLSRPCTFRL